MELICTGCNKKPQELLEYVEAAEDENITPDEFVWQEEGTLNKSNGHFLCTLCYMEAGMPEHPSGWKAP